MWKLYVWCGRILAKLRLRRFIFGRSKRVRLVLCTSDDQILLVRNWYGNQKWTLPGGGVKRREPETQAVVRELREETGVNITSHSVEYLGEYPCYESSRVFTIKCYYSSINSLVDITRSKNIEILERKWFSISHLPPDLGIEIERIFKNIP
jgi:ADP-ribose pyrophosphatase YjhB (NUDIX family)